MFRSMVRWMDGVGGEDERKQEYDEAGMVWIGLGWVGLGWRCDEMLIDLFAWMD